jgi:signal transduction histidine kinase
MSDFSQVKPFYSDLLRENARTSDRIFAYLFIFQWILAVAFAIYFSPLTWNGDQSELNPHVLLAIFFGGVLALPPLYLGFFRPGESWNKYVIATAQILYSSLLIDLTGGRIETHFHIFGSLAFLAIYRDFRTIFMAAIVSSLDHILRGYYSPESIYGVLSASPLRSLEHAAWMVFEVAVLYRMIKQGRVNMLKLAETHVKLELQIENTEKMVMERTKDLERSRELILSQQALILQSAKMSALGAMAGGIAHEINNPIAIIQGCASQALRMLKVLENPPAAVLRKLQTIEGTSSRITKIVLGLRALAGKGEKDPFVETPARAIISEVVSICEEKYKISGVTLKAPADSDDSLECRSVQIEQVLINLLNNAFDEVVGQPQPWIDIEVRPCLKGLEFAVTDSGKKIPPDIAEKIMQPFFTTKQAGKGTGLGLSISKSIIEEHGGKLWVDLHSPFTRFVFWLPCKQEKRETGSLAA